MNAYFDFHNFLSLIHSANDIRYGDCIRMIKDNFKINFTFSKDYIAKAKHDDKMDIMQWFTNMATGMGDISWESKIPSRPININQIKTPPNNISVYCLDEAQYNALEGLIKKGIIIIAKVGDEIEAFSGLLIYSNQYTKNIFANIQDWEDIKDYSSPCTDIIIVDQYIFSSPELYEPNLYKLIKCLADHSQNEKLNIVIVTLNKLYNKKTNFTFEPDWNKIYSELRSKINKKFRPNITFITASQGRLEEHDRTIFTNYKTFASGDTYNYFDNKGNKITNGRYLHAHSLADKDNMRDALKLLDDLQKLVNELKSLNDSLIMKDRVCNFLNF